MVSSVAVLYSNVASNTKMAILSCWKVSNRELGNGLLLTFAFFIMQLSQPQNEELHSDHFAPILLNLAMKTWRSVGRKSAKTERVLSLRQQNDSINFMV
jgi:hypothetical protein